MLIHVDTRCLFHSRLSYSSSLLLPRVPWSAGGGTCDCTPTLKSAMFPSEKLSQYEKRTFFPFPPPFCKFTWAWAIGAKRLMVCDVFLWSLGRVRWFPGIQGVFPKIQGVLTCVCCSAGIITVYSTCNHVLRLIK